MQEASIINGKLWHFATDLFRRLERLPWFPRSKVGLFHIVPINGVIRQRRCGVMGESLGTKTWVMSAHFLVLTLRKRSILSGRVLFLPPINKSRRKN